MKNTKLLSIITTMTMAISYTVALTPALTASAVTPQPVLSLSKLDLNWSELDENNDGIIDEDKRVQEVEVSVSGANYLWCYCGIHVFFPSEIAPHVDPLTDQLERTYGKAVSKAALSTVVYATGETENMVFASFAATTTITNYFDDGTPMYRGKDGMMFSFEVVLPADASPGEKWDFSFKYVVTPPSVAGGRSINDLFTNADYYRAADEKGLNTDEMTQYAIDHWQNGYINILDDRPTEPTTEPTTEAATNEPTTEATSKNLVITNPESTVTGDINNDGIFDLSDIVGITNYLTNTSKYPLPPRALKNADVAGNGDGVTTQDVFYLTQLIVNNN
ncbi:MAG: dockerin type I repeat-containing protein [Ruminococcus sp.]|jgi:hypothetical protein|nr:dockerin type I repeat-containing protein [Ruminococcus sp.]